MSKETDQSILLIAIIAGCLETYRQTNAFSRVDIKNDISNAFEKCQLAIIEWPLMSNRYWVKERREKFMAFIDKHPAQHFPPPAMACMCERITTDLLYRCKGSRKKLELLNPIAEISEKIHNFCDATGSNFQAYELSDELLDYLYEIIDMREFA